MPLTVCFSAKLQHHFGLDQRYNAPTFLNLITRKFRKCGLKLFAMTLPWTVDGKSYARQCFCRDCQELKPADQLIARGTLQTWLPKGRGAGDHAPFRFWQPDPAHPVNYA